MSKSDDGDASFLCLLERIESGEDHVAQHWSTGWPVYFCIGTLLFSLAATSMFLRKRSVSTNPEVATALADVKTASESTLAHTSFEETSSQSQKKVSIAQLVIKKDDSQPRLQSPKVTASPIVKPCVEIVRIGEVNVKDGFMAEREDSLFQGRSTRIFATEKDIADMLTPKELR